MLMKSKEIVKELAAWCRVDVAPQLWTGFEHLARESPYAHSYPKGTCLHQWMSRASKI